MSVEGARRARQPPQPPAPVQTHDHPMASVVRFSSPPAEDQLRAQAGSPGHHVVDVDINGTEPSASELSLSYGADPRAKLPFRKRVRRSIRRVFEEIWADALFFRLPAMYKERVSQAAMGCGCLDKGKSRVRNWTRTRRGAKSSRLSGYRPGGLEETGETETENETDTEIDHVYGGKQVFRASRTSQLSHGASRESVNTFGDWDCRAGSYWDGLVGDLLQEWKTTGIGAGLVIVASLLLLQLTPTDIITRTGCVFSFICAATSLLSAIACMVRFSGMRMEGKATILAQKSLEKDYVIWWNIWIAISVPLTWSIWSLVLLLTSAMTFTWRSTAGSSLSSIGASVTDTVLPFRVVLGIRVGVSALLGLGVLSVMMMLVTLDRLKGREVMSERPVSVPALGGRVGRGHARGRPDSQSSDDDQQFVSRVSRDITTITPQAQPEQPRNQTGDSEPRVVFPTLTPGSAAHIQNAPEASASSPEPQGSSPQGPLSPYLSSSSDVPAHPSRSDPSLPARIGQVQGKGKRTVSTSQLVGVPVTSSSNASSGSKGNVSKSAVSGKSTGSGSGAGKRSGQSGQTAQRQSHSRKSSAASVARPKRQSRTTSTQSRTAQGTSHSGRR
ncbi:hypothetical protein D9758_004377 [Tetrapyrgos nigripes]|uniref:Transmembrane protein n=1 Tax=Tetrapyrgos nigripes TaxID=182062 RepID=A0A8H5GN83_9AGAR|nr:hypothetical protein D9758_004377 [Tetrapyrgos nigripes]